ncbi:MAG TPA: hypothetical protein PLQ69_00110 [Paludibacter sp.]|nr:hypothetical protein [Paludibacter sp.]HPM08907.1 hypothetical protein [Paludibacter sp.]
MFSVLKEYFIIWFSGLFDKKYYLQKNPDVKNAGLNPLLHFVKNGWREGRSPSKYFDLPFYQKNNVDVKKANINPLVHYIISGKKEGRHPTPDSSGRSTKPIFRKKAPLSSMKRMAPNYQHLQISRIINKTELILLFKKSQEILKNYGMREFLKKVAKKISTCTHRSKNDFSVIHISRSNHQIGIFGPKQLNSKRILNVLNEKIKKNGYTLSLSHDNYLSVSGGVQNKLSDEEYSNNNSGISYLHIYPYFFSNYLVNDDDRFYIGINLDGKGLGISEAEEFIKAISKITSKKFTGMDIHHTMGFNIKFIQNVINISKLDEIRFWLHDMFSVCPNYVLLRNNLEYCGAPDISSNSCSICKFNEIRKVQQNELAPILNDCRIKIIAPSEFAFSFWKSRVKTDIENHTIAANAQLKWQNHKDKTPLNEPLRIAFLGFPIKHKGWEIYKALSDYFKNDQRYKFYLFSSMQAGQGNFSQIPVSVTKINRNLMSQTLRNNHIDVAILWSLCPETFSFTLYEALAAGCYIITNPNSGNIQAYLKQYKNRGVIYPDSHGLLESFTNSDIIHKVSKYQAKGRPQGILVY